MKCPLLNPKVSTTSSGHTSTKGDCLKEDCAWWDEDGEQCSELSEGKALRWISMSLLEIRDKLPYPPAPKH